MKQNSRDIASELIESTVKVIARDGFDKASTRNIAGECGIADAYIYVHFKDKDDLFAKAFQKEDVALVTEVKKYLTILNQQEITNEDRLYVLFNKVWMQMVTRPDNCRFYVQYYYSPYYQKYSEQEHLTFWTPILEQMQVLFRPGTDVKALLHSALSMMLSQAIKTAAQPSIDKDASARKNYEMVLGILGTCLREE